MSTLCACCSERSLGARQRGTLCARCLANARAKWERRKARIVQEMLWEAVLAGAIPSCYHCPARLTPSTAVIDHLVPLARGGSDERDNLVWSCSPCNNAKDCSLVERMEVMA